MALGKVNRTELTLIADVLPMQYDLVIKRTLREAQGMLWANLPPSEQPSRCSSSQISPSPRTHATSASGVEAGQRHRSLLRAPRRKSYPIRRRSAEHDDQSATGRSGRT